MGLTLLGPMAPQVPTLLTWDEPIASGDVQQPQILVMLEVPRLFADA